MPPLHSWRKYSYPGAAMALPASILQHASVLEVGASIRQPGALEKYYATGLSSSNQYSSP